MAGLVEGELIFGVKVAFIENFNETGFADLDDFGRHFLLHLGIDSEV